MEKLKPGQSILVGLILFALSIVAVDISGLLGADVPSGWAAHQLHGSFYHVAGPFNSLPYIGAAGMLSLALVKRMTLARRAAVGGFGVFVVAGILWWAIAAEVPPGVPTGEVVFARLCWFILMPVAYVATLYLPGVTRYLSRSTEAEQP